MLIGTAILLSLIVILLAMPVTLTYQFSWKQTPSANIRLNWAFGLVRTDVSPDLAKPEPGKPEPDSKKASRRRRSKGRKTNFMAAVRHASFRRRMIRFASDVWHAIHKQDVRLLVRMGLGDPADTGRLWAVLGPLSGMCSRIRDVRIAIEPNFLEPTFEMDSSGTVRMIPLQVGIIALGLLVSPAIWQGIFLMRASG